MGARDEVAIVGSGSMAAAIAQASMAAGRAVAIWCPDPAHGAAITERLERAAPGYASRVRVSAALPDVARDARLVVMAVPSADYRDVARELGSLELDGKALLSATKGFERETWAPLSDVLRRETT